jgi:transcriptional antiterminator NusG
MFDDREKKDDLFEGLDESAGAEAEEVAEDEEVDEAEEAAEADAEKDEAEPKPGTAASDPTSGDEMTADDLFLDLPDVDVADEEPADEAATTAEPAADAVDELDALVGELDAAEPQGEGDLLDAIEIELSPEEQAEIERRSRLQWFTIHANTGHENKVKRNIEMAIKSNHMDEFFGDVLVPVQEVTEMKNGKRVTSKRKFLPGYLLVEMLMNKETQHFINSVPGVTGFIGGTPQKPQPVPKDEVDRILGRIKEPDEAGKDVLEIPYNVGDSVQVMDGPFADWVGIINEINHEKGKLKVMISIFGKDTPVELDFLQVKQV